MCAPFVWASDQAQLNWISTLAEAYNCIMYLNLFKTIRIQITNINVIRFHNNTNEEQTKTKPKQSQAEKKNEIKVKICNVTQQIIQNAYCQWLCVVVAKFFVFNRWKMKETIIIDAKNQFYHYRITIDVYEYESEFPQSVHKHRRQNFVFT